MRTIIFLVLCLAGLSCTNSDATNHTKDNKVLNEAFSKDMTPFLGNWQIEFYLDQKYQHSLSITEASGILVAEMDGQPQEIALEVPGISFTTDLAKFEGKIMGSTIWGKLKTIEGPYSNQRISWTATRN